ncbi:TetR/AcrR family transcriptional regulator [Streptomyces sp. NPDC093228]|jgi:TetR/AcrR family transcriptional repressor of nem operon|uniref:TetR/AcrR family transcriptional regulator n=1 Tax=Streptomyces sp. NPDC093228 TaxID=3155070 RepID=UPI003441A207
MSPVSQAEAKVGIADVMKSIGLTQGGFYKQFASKTALVDEATAKAFADNLHDLVALGQEAGERQAALQSLLESYFSVEHRDNLGTGCPAAGFVGDVAPELEHRDTYARGVQELAEWIAPATPVWPPTPRSSAAYFLPAPPRERLCRNASCGHHMPR